METDVLTSIKGKLIVSCQALQGEPLYGPEIMSRMALAAFQGGAAGIRANTVEDITAIKKAVNLPIIGIIKKEYFDSQIYITPTIKEVEALNEAGVDIIAADFTDRIRPYGQNPENFMDEIKKRFPKQMIMADISTFDEGVKAEKLGADLVSTTLSGYTSYSLKSEGPDFHLINNLSKILKVPVIAEGRIYCPEDACKALELGAYAVVVGGAITRPLEITKRFINKIMAGNKEIE